MKTVGFFLILTFFISCVQEIPADKEEVFSGTNIKRGPAGEIPQTVNGSVLYARNCMSCHDSLSVSTKKDRTSAQIKDAIDNNSFMNGITSLRDLSLEQINMISEALKVPAGGSDQTITELKQTYVIGTKKYIASKFKQIFYHQENDSQVLSVINNILNSDKGFFGGNCTIADTDCNGDISVKSEGSMSPDSHPIRSAILYNTCEIILNRNTAVTSALRAANLTEQSDGSNSNNIIKLFDVFYPGFPASTDIISSLQDTYIKAKNENLSDNEAWKMVMDPLCKSSLFETF